MNPAPRQSLPRRSKPQKRGMTGFLALSAEVRCLIYTYLFLQPGHKVNALSREPVYDYSKGISNDWYADSRQAGLVYESHAERSQPTNASFLRTCRSINNEATPVFYGANKIIAYAEDNNDIFYWLLDIGEQNRRAIRHLEIGWAYGVSIESGRGNIHGILQTIEDMEESEEDEIRMHRQQLMEVLRRLEKKTTRLIVRTINLLITNQNLQSLSVYLPGVDGGDIWDLPNPNLYFAEELFSNSTNNVHACIPEALSRMIGIKTLTIGYTKDIELAEEIARATGAKELFIETRPEGDTLLLDTEEQAEWRNRGWRLEGRTAKKTLVAITENKGSMGETKEEKEKEKEKEGKEMTKAESGYWSEGYSEGGRLKASMLFETENRKKDKKRPGQRGHQADYDGSE